MPVSVTSDDTQHAPASSLVSAKLVPERAATSRQISTHFWQYANPTIFLVLPTRRRATLDSHIKDQHHLVTDIFIINIWIDDLHDDSLIFFTTTYGL
eukprot:6214803-Pleurochrysis_carterae.AAC.2